MPHVIPGSSSFLVRWGERGWNGLEKVARIITKLWAVLFPTAFILGVIFNPWVGVGLLSFCLLIVLSVQGRAPPPDDASSEAPTLCSLPTEEPPDSPAPSECLPEIRPFQQSLPTVMEEEDLISPRSSDKERLLAEREWIAFLHNVHQKTVASLVGSDRDAFSDVSSVPFSHASRVSLERPYAIAALCHHNHPLICPLTDNPWPPSMTYATLNGSPLVASIGQLVSALHIPPPQTSQQQAKTEVYALFSLVYAHAISRSACITRPKEILEETLSALLHGAKVGEKELGLYSLPPPLQSPTTHYHELSHLPLARLTLISSAMDTLNTSHGQIVIVSNQSPSQVLQEIEHERYESTLAQLCLQSTLYVQLHLACRQEGPLYGAVEVITVGPAQGYSFCAARKVHVLLVPKGRPQEIVQQAVQWATHINATTLFVTKEVTEHLTQQQKKEWCPKAGQRATHPFRGTLRIHCEALPVQLSVSEASPKTHFHRYPNNLFWAVGRPQELHAQKGNDLMWNQVFPPEKLFQALDKLPAEQRASHTLCGGIPKMRAGIMMVPDSTSLRTKQDRLATAALEAWHEGRPALFIPKESVQVMGGWPALREIVHKMASWSSIRVTCECPNEERNREGDF